MGSYPICQHSSLGKEPHTLVNILLRSQLGNKKNSETKFQLLNYIFKSGPFPVSFYLFSSFQYSW